jgi:transcription antitermination factor NusG
VSAPWYAIWTRSRHEQVVRDQIAGKGYEAFLPTVTRWSRWKDRKKKIDWPLFPGYCFARFDPEERLPILKCTGVVNIVAFNGEIAPIPEHEIEGIRRLLDSNLQYDPCPFIREGMVVEVVSWPLKGVIGRIVRKGAHARLVLAVDLIGRPSAWKLTRRMSGRMISGWGTEEAEDTERAQHGDSEHTEIK